MVESVVLGLDGATWDVLEPLMKKNRLPNLKEVVNGNSHGGLKSTFPPITAPAWLSLARGQNPGRIGVIYLLNRENYDSLNFQPLGQEELTTHSRAVVG